MLNGREQTRIYHKIVTILAGQLLRIEAEGNYNEALKLIEDYGYLASETTDSISNLNEIPKDLDLSFSVDL